MDTTDGFGGFKVMHHFKNVALAVSKSDKLEVGKVYGAPAGWHWASRAEVEAIMGGGTEMREPAMLYYENQGGWSGFKWGGVMRSTFVFKDSLEVGGCILAGGEEGLVNTSFSAATLAQAMPNQLFAGIVCVRDAASRAAAVAARVTVTFINRLPHVVSLNWFKQPSWKLVHRGIGAGAQARLTTYAGERRHDTALPLLQLK
eukprot:SAG22_NODE_88_length_21409_cov_11.207180_18_plen_202_part_00